MLSRGSKDEFLLTEQFLLENKYKFYSVKGVSY